MWEYGYTDELYHYGVKGMKWGVRRAQKRTLRANQSIRRIEADRKYNKERLNLANKEAQENYGNKNFKKVVRSQARNKAVYDRSEKYNKYAIEIDKARIDKTHKKSDAYKKARSEWNKQVSQELIYGEFGSQRIDTLKNMGYSDKKAKGRAMAEVALATVGYMAIVGGASYLANKS